MRNKIDTPLVIWMIVLILLSSLPVMLGFAAQNDQWRFSGFVMNLDDGNSYIAKMMQGYQGAWLYQAPYSLEPQNGLLVFLPYILLGKLAAPPALHTQMVVLFHLYRVFGIIVLVAGIDRFLQLFPLKRGYRYLAIILSTAGGGLGWLILLFRQSSLAGWLPLEFISPEGFGFISAYTIPHLALARGLLFGALALFVEGIPVWEASGKIPRKWLVVSLALLVTGFLQPMNCVIACLWMGVIPLVSFIRNRRFSPAALKVGWIFLPAVAWIAYILIMSQVDPFLQEWNKQNIVDSPPWQVYLLSYGLFYLWIIVNFRKLRVAIKSVQDWFCILWMVSVPFLVYFPVNIQRRLSEGIWVVIILLLLRIIQEYRLPLQKIAVAALVLITIPSTIMLIWMGVRAASSLSSPVFVRQDVVDLYLRAGDMSEGGNFLTSFRNGNEITAWAPVRVTLGHGPETIHYSKFKNMYDAYINGSADQSMRYSWLEQYGVRYAIVDLSQIHPLQDEARYGKPVYLNGNLAIMETVP